MLYEIKNLGKLYMKLMTNDIIYDLNRWHKAYNNSIFALNYSKNTIMLYNRIILSFIEYSRGFQDEMQLNEIKSSFIVGYIAYIENNTKNRPKLSKSTKQTYIKAIKSFFAFISNNNDELYSFEYFFKNINILDTSKPEEKIEYLNELEIQKLIETLEKIKSTKEDYNSYRNSLLIKLMLYSGLRISEALKVTLDDFIIDDNETYHIKIYAKGGKRQVSFIIKSLIEDELSFFKNEAKLEFDELIMQTKNKKPLNRSNAFIIINKIYKKAFIRKTGLHLLRHTLAMQLTNKNINLSVIQKILRHSNIATTTVYAKATKQSQIGALKTIL